MIFSGLIGKLPSHFSYRLAIVITLILLLNLGVFFTVGAYHDNDKIELYDTPIYHVPIGGTPSAANDTFQSENILIFNSKNRSICIIAFEPFKPNSSGKLDAVLTLTRQSGRFISIEIIYWVENETPHSILLKNSFSEEYSDSEWRGQVDIPENSNWSYSFKIQHTFRSSDVYRFYDRAETAFHGDVLYRDTRYRTETPPLINYLLIPGYLLARVTNETFGFSMYFIFSAVVASALVYILFRRWGDDRAFMMALLFGVYPALFRGSRFAQDEPLVAIFFIIPIFLMLIDSKRGSALMIGLGLCIKMWTILLIPAAIVSWGAKGPWQKRPRDVAVTTLWMIIPIMIVLIPFYVLAGKDFLFFLETYIGMGGHVGKSASLWYEMIGDMGYYSELKLLAMMLIAISSLLLMVKSCFKPVHPLRMTMVILSVFFLLYFKILSGYYAFFIVPFLPAMTEDKYLTLELFAITLLVGMGNLSYSIWLLIIAWILLLDVLRRALTKEYGFDNDLGNGRVVDHYEPFFASPWKHSER